MRTSHGLAGLAGVAALLALPIGAPAQAQTILNVTTAGSENMVDYVTDYLAPKFKATHPDVEIRVVGTGPGDAGSQKIYEKLAAQKAAGAAEVDVDVAVIHQKMAGQMVEEGLLAKYRDDIETGKLVTRDTATNALGTDVDGYVMPMFHSQTAIAYNPALISDPPQSYAELAEWVKEYPGQFGYNGIREGMSGVAFVVGWIYSNTEGDEQLLNGPYDPALKETWRDALAQLKDFNEYVTFTPSNAGTLDMLNRGEIGMGPVWVDMFYTWQADGRLAPDVKLELIEPGMPGQPMYYVTPENAAQPELARDFIALATSPEVQAEGIVKTFNWYPGIDAEHIQQAVDEATWDKLFADVTPEELASKGKPFPIGPYFDDILEAYERNVEN
jgi:putative spermidine/putrescine transport system substrate-binding protein